MCWISSRLRRCPQTFWNHKNSCNLCRAAIKPSTFLRGGIQIQEFPLERAAQLFGLGLFGPAGHGRTKPALRCILSRQKSDLSLWHFCGNKGSTEQRHRGRPTPSAYSQERVRVSSFCRTGKRWHPSGGTRLTKAKSSSLVTFGICYFHFRKCRSFSHLQITRRENRTPESVSGSPLTGKSCF